MSLSLPVLTTVVSAVLVATFVTSRQDIRTQQRERELQTRAQIANEISSSSVKGITAAEEESDAFDPPSIQRARRLYRQTKSGFVAESLLIRAKLLAYYPTPEIAHDWSRYAREVKAFVVLGFYPPPAPRDARVKLIEILRAYLPRPPGVRWEALLTPASNVEFTVNYESLGDALSDSVADVTREALTGKRQPGS